jgi:hypothetical protein
VSEDRVVRKHQGDCAARGRKVICRGGELRDTVDRVDEVRRPAQLVGRESAGVRI